MNRELYPNNPTPENGMTPEEANFAFGLISQLYDESFESVGKIRALTLKLVQEPETFWEYYSYVTGGELNRTLRDQAVAFIQQPGFTGSIEDMQRFTGAV